MTAILYMIGTLMLVGGILLIGRAGPYGAVLLVAGVVLLLVNLLRLLRGRDAGE